MPHSHGGAVVPATSYPAILGAVLVRLREERGLTQAVLAVRMGLAPSTWSRIEGGFSALSIDQLARVAEILGVRVGDIAQRADVAQDAVRKRQVHVVPARLSHDEAVNLGLVLMGG